MNTTTLRKFRARWASLRMAHASGLAVRVRDKDTDAFLGVNYMSNPRHELSYTIGKDARTGEDTIKFGDGWTVNRRGDGVP